MGGKSVQHKTSAAVSIPAKSERKEPILIKKNHSIDHMSFRTCRAEAGGSQISYAAAVAGAAAADSQTSLDVHLEKENSQVIPFQGPEDEVLMSSLNRLGQDEPVVPSTSTMLSTPTPPASPPWSPVLAPSQVAAVAMDMTVEGPAADGGKNGAWIVCDSRGGRWIFKPQDEEGLRDPDDEDGLVDPEEDYRKLTSGSTAKMMVLTDGKVPLKNGILWGQTTKKEQAAYLLDHDHFAGVPVTYALHLITTGKDGKSCARFGSLQQYKENLGSTEDHGESLFPTEDIHKIGILDIRLLNLDRHLGNILVTKGPGGKRQLIPIDHGFILPDFRNISDTNFEWLNFRQCRSPFSSETKAYINKLDIFADARKLKSLDIRDEAVMGSMTSTLLLKRGAARDLTLYDLGNMIQRRGLGEEKSVLEQIIDKTLDTVAKTLAKTKEIHSPTTALMRESDSFPALDLKDKEDDHDDHSLFKLDDDESSIKKECEAKFSPISKIPMSRSRSVPHLSTKAGDNGAERRRPIYLQRTDEIFRRLYEFHSEHPRCSEPVPLTRSYSECWKSPSTSSQLAPLTILPYSGFQLDDSTPRVECDSKDEEIPPEPPTPRELRTHLGSGVRELQNELRSESSPSRKERSLSEEEREKEAQIISLKTKPRGLFVTSPPSKLRTMVSSTRPVPIAMPSLEKRATSDIHPVSIPALPPSSSRRETESREIIEVSTSPPDVPLGSSPPDPAAQVARDVILPSWTWHDTRQSKRRVPLPERHQWLKLYFKWVSQYIDEAIEKQIKQNMEDKAKIAPTSSRRMVRSSREED